MEIIGILVGIFSLCAGIFSVAYQLGKDSYDDHSHHDKTQK